MHRLFYVVVLSAALSTTSVRAQQPSPIVEFQTQPLGKVVVSGEQLLNQVADVLVRMDSLMRGVEPGGQASTIAQLSKKGQLVRSVFDFLGEKWAKDWRDYIDLERPLLGYLLFDLEAEPQNATILLLPIKGNPARFETFLGRIGEVDALDGGVKRLTIGGNWSVYWRVVADYAYFSLTDAAALNGKPLPAASLQREMGQHLFEARVYPSRLPDALITLVKFASSSAIEEAMRQVDNDPSINESMRPWQKKFIKRMMDTMFNLVLQGDSLLIAPTWEPAQQVMSWEFMVKARDGSAFAADIRQVPNAPSPFAQLADEQSAAFFQLNLPLPIEFAKLMEMGMREAAEDDFNDPDQLKSFEKYLKLFQPTLNSGRLQLALALHADEVGHTLSFGMGMQKSRDLEAFLRKDWAEGVPVEFDHFKVGGVSVHEIGIPNGEPEGFTEIFGNGPAYMAFREDAFVFTVGREGKKRISKMITAVAGPAPRLSMGGTIEPLLPIIRTIDPKAVPWAKSLVASGRKSVRGEIDWKGGDTFNLRVRSNLWDWLIGAAVQMSARKSVID